MVDDGPAASSTGSIAVQTGPAGHLSPIGNGWWPRGGARSQFDQQPIEATTLLLAGRGGASRRRPTTAIGRPMERAYAWFLGDNDLGLAVADPGPRAPATTA